ncbi:MAG: hypothetical protein B7Z08_05775, partial [Sphingomonadales bacterium 32-68-7]
VFFYSGSFTSRKGSDMLVESFRRIASRHPQARLVLVGAGEMERQMRNTLQPCADRVTWLGFQPWHKLPECYQQGTIFCFPSRYDGWGLSMVEALASGMPSIGTDRTGSALEFLADHKAGWLVEAGNRHELEQAMEQALLLPERSFIPRLARFWNGDTRGRIAAGAVVGVAAILAWLLIGFAEREEGAAILFTVVALVLLGIAVIGARWAYLAVVLLIMLGHGGVKTLEGSLRGDRVRSYFGVYAVQPVDEGRQLQLSHGTTVHGRQWLVPERRYEPTTYYGPSSGVGVALEAAAPDASIGVVGVGVGTLACYRQPAQDWTFFEIDPAVLDYSRGGTFTFLSHCTPDARMVIGDARLKLAEEPAARFDVLVIDAFSSDSIPMHLLTREAFATYRRVIESDGVLLVHISNRFIDLAPMIAALAQDGGWQGRLRADDVGKAEGVTPSVWIALARDDSVLATLEGPGAPRWSALPRPSLRAWTDDNASILPLIRW